MRLRRAFTTALLGISLTAGLTACGSTEAAKPDQQMAEADTEQARPRAMENISYVDGDNIKGHMLDLYFPAGEHEKLPLLVWIHGGAWTEGDKQPSPMMPFLSKGFAVAGINYRLTPESKFPDQVHDCKAAIRWLRKHADEYGFDKNRIGVFGVSAGGHLAAMLGATNGVKELEGNVGETSESSDIQAVCDWCGPSDLLTMHKQAGKEDKLDYSSPKAPITMFIGAPAEEKPDIAKQASPVTYLKPGLKVPCLIMHAERDPIVPYAQSAELYEAWKKTGAPAQLEKINTDQHIFISVPTILTVVNFFEKALGTGDSQKAAGSKEKR